jgi:hypothetical protein
VILLRDITDVYEAHSHGATYMYSIELLDQISDTYKHMLEQNIRSYKLLCSLR